MAKVEDCANLLIELTNKDENTDDMTNLRLNKLLYFAQGHYLARYGKPLFDDEIEAWKFGSIVPRIYGKYENRGKQPIMSFDVVDTSKAFTDNEFEMLVTVLQEYKPMSTWSLVNLNHEKGSPWDKFYLKGKYHAKIDKEDIREYFKTKPITTLSDKIKKLPVVEVLPSEDYDPEEDDLDEWVVL